MKNILEPHCIGDLLLLPATYADSIYLPSEVLLVKGNNVGVHFDKMNSLREKIEHGYRLFINLWRHVKMVHKLKIHNQGSILFRRIIVY